MIRDSGSLSGIRNDWKGVELLHEKLQRSAFSSTGVIGGSFPFALANAARNVPFIHAFSVLNEVLIALEKEGHFKCKSIFIGALLKASENNLSWRDFSVIEAGVCRRNDVAHRGDLLERKECWKYIEAIRVELRSWDVI